MRCKNCRIRQEKKCLPFQKRAGLKSPDKTTPKITGASQDWNLFLRPSFSTQCGSRRIWPYNFLLCCFGSHYQSYYLCCGQKITALS